MTDKDTVYNFLSLLAERLEAAGARGHNVVIDSNAVDQYADLLRWVVRDRNEHRREVAE